MKTLSQSEFREFRDFIHSPIFNKNKKVKSLFDSLKDFYPEFKNKKLTDENIFKIIYQDEKYDYYKIKNIISDLFSLGKEFIAFLHYRDISNVSGKFLLEQLRDRSLDSIFEQTYKIYNKELEEAKIRDENYINYKLMLIEEIHSFKTPKEPNSNLHFVQEEMDNFLKYSIIKLLKYYNIMLHEKHQNNYDYDLKMFDEIMEYFKRSKTEDNPTLLIYYYIILLDKEKDEKYFFELKKLKNKYFDELNNGDRYMLFLHMASFCAYIFNVKGRTDFMNEHFFLSKENFDRGTIVLGKILYPDFLNHVKIAVRVNEFEWAEKYIEEFKHLLTEEKESTLNFCYGFINYRKGNLDKALELFSRTNFPNFLIKVQVKILLLQIYYEKDFYDQALTMMDTFKHYLTREKSIPEDFKESHFDFIRITNELVKLKTHISLNQRDYNIKKIKDDIQKMKFNQFGIKNWLKEKIEDLK
ncbi:MAG: hypothetical protein ABI840_03370 [bacterium]